MKMSRVSRQPRDATGASVRGRGLCVTSLAGHCPRRAVAVSTRGYGEAPRSLEKMMSILWGT